ncbi:MAG: hypothetical protein ATN36_07895 [Epulopiscium sp. Nele67-Bin005]|nr:MAG: hypothetical protein ATN36_07895 [Epulopiscium sp. Nele67-Bin005]
MANVLQDNSNELSIINYNKILAVITEEIGQLELEATADFIDLHPILRFVKHISAKLGAGTNYNAYDILKIDKNKSPKVISINHEKYEEFANIIKEVSNKIYIKNNHLIKMNSIMDFQKKQISEYRFGLEHNFVGKNFSKSQVSMMDNSATNKRLRVSNVEIKLPIQDIDHKLKDNIKQVLVKNNDPSDIVIEEKVRLIDEGNSEVEGIVELLNDESLPRIRRTLSYMYMIYLLRNSDDHESLKLAKNYVLRILDIEKFLSELNLSSNEEREVNLGTNTYDICDILSRGDAFSVLPFIGKIEKVLSEETTDTHKTFKLAISMKLNGVVQNTGSNSKSAFEFHIEQILNPEISDEARIKRFFLYSSLFIMLEDKEYPFREYWGTLKKEIEEHGLNEVAKFLINIYFDKNSEHGNKLNKQIKGLEQYFKGTVSNEREFKDIDLSLNLLLYKGILADACDENILKPVKNNWRTPYLKYVSVLNDDDNVGTLLNIPLEVKWKTQSLYEDNKVDTIKMDYDLNNISSLPVVIYPNIERTNEDFYGLINKSLNGRYHVRLPYMLDEKDVLEQKGLINVLIYNIISYMVVDKILSYLNLIKDKNLKDTDEVLPTQLAKNLYIPVFRVHTVEQKNSNSRAGAYMGRLGKMLAQLLAIDYKSNSQGLIWNNSKPNRSSYANAQTSLYSRLPKKFKTSKDINIRKIAIIVVSSRKCDAKRTAKNQDNEIYLLSGEVILFSKQRDKTINCETYKSFSDYYTKEQLYKSPVILKDIVNEIYKKGYKRILYISQAPYTSKLNLTTKIKNEYFMSDRLMEEIYQFDNIKIYPLYFEEYSCFDFKEKSVQSKDIAALYINNSSEIEKIYSSEKQSVMGVLNLYAATNSKMGFYNGVILYSTLMNIYREQKMNDAINNDMINEGIGKDALTDIMILLHYARAESSFARTIKVNPYENLIGDESTPAKAIFDFQMELNVYLKVNMLALLTDVKKIIDRGDR